LQAFYSDTFVLPLPEHHRFPMAKYRLVRERIVADGILSADDLHVPDPIPWADLLLVHDPQYVDAVANGTLRADMQRRIGFPWSPRMVERSRRSVGATLAAARAALAGWNRLKAVPCTLDVAQPDDRADAARTRPGISANLAGGTHHAFRDRGEGYCVFNDVAVAATVLLRDAAVSRVAVIDCDVHQGNGTASIFRDEPRVFTLSFHGARNFPFRKEVSDLDVTFEDGARDDEYLAALVEHVPRVLDAHRPDVVFYLAGADPYEGDRLGRLKLSIDGLRRRDRFVFEACRDRAVPVAITMSGGYCPDVDAIVTIHVNTIAEAVRSTASFDVRPESIDPRARASRVSA
jgi:acetoin utilization deacetylase AcuC-like enzyme